MGVLSDENPYTVLPQEEILVGEQTPQHIDNNTNDSDIGLVSIVASEPCLKCQHDKLINKARLIIIAPAILQLLASFGWFSILAPIIGLIALITKSKFFTIFHFITAIITYISYSLSLSVTTISCITSNIGFGIVFAIVSVLFLFLFAITLRNYVTYCKLLVKKNNFECTCEKSDLTITDSDILQYEINSSLYPGQVVQPTTSVNTINTAPQVPFNGVQYYVMPYPQQVNGQQPQQIPQPMMMPQGMYPPQPYFFPVMYNPNVFPQQPQPQSK